MRYNNQKQGSTLLFFTVAISALFIGLAVISVQKSENILKSVGLMSKSEQAKLASDVVYDAMLEFLEEGFEHDREDPSTFNGLEVSVLDAPDGYPEGLVNGSFKLETNLDVEVAEGGPDHAALSLTCKGPCGLDHSDFVFPRKSRIEARLVTMADGIVNSEVVAISLRPNTLFDDGAQIDEIYGDVTDNASLPTWAVASGHGRIRLNPTALCNMDESGFNNYLRRLARSNSCSDDLSSDVGLASTQKNRESFRDEDVSAMFYEHPVALRLDSMGWSVTRIVDQYETHAEATSLDEYVPEFSTADDLLSASDDAEVESRYRDFIARINRYERDGFLELFNIGTYSEIGLEQVGGNGEAADDFASQVAARPGVYHPWLDVDRRTAQVTEFENADLPSLFAYSKVQDLCDSGLDAQVPDVEDAVSSFLSSANDSEEEIEVVTCNTLSCSLQFTSDTELRVRDGGSVSSYSVSTNRDRVFVIDAPTGAVPVIADSKSNARAVIAYEGDFRVEGNIRQTASTATTRASSRTELESSGGPSIGILSGGTLTIATNKMKRLEVDENGELVTSSDEVVAEVSDSASESDPPTSLIQAGIAASELKVEEYTEGGGGSVNIQGSVHLTKPPVTAVLTADSGGNCDSAGSVPIFDLIPGDELPGPGVGGSTLKVLSRRTADELAKK